MCIYIYSHDDNNHNDNTTNDTNDTTTTNNNDHKDNTTNNDTNDNDDIGIYIYKEAGTGEERIQQCTRLRTAHTHRHT